MNGLGFDLPFKAKSTLFHLNSFSWELCTVYTWLKLTVLLWTTFSVHVNIHASEANFLLSVHLEGTFWGANGHF